MISLRKVVQKFYKDVKSRKLHDPKAKLLIPYNLFRGMSLAYAPGIKVAFYKKPIGYLFYWIGKLAGNLKGM